MTTSLTDVSFGLEAEPVRIAGALALPPGRHGKTVSRLSTRSLGQILDLEFGLIATSPSGSRIELRTDADVVEVELYLTRLQVLERPPTPLSLDVVVDDGAARQIVCPEGAVLQVRGPRHMELADSHPITVVIDDLGIAMKSIEIWLPHNGFAEVCAVRVASGSIVTQPAPKPVRWVHYGSSISHCVESRRPTETWPAVVARRHGLDLLNLGLAGHCHLDQLVARDIREA
ncbi:MAG: SGNH/GDSL hydrolase family protein, partial [Nocardioides sp.]